MKPEIKSIIGVRYESEVYSLLRFDYVVIEYYNAQLERKTDRYIVRCVKVM